MKNKYTETPLLTNEAAVEDLFVSRLIRDLGFSDADIAHKSSIKPVKIHVGSKASRYAPDYILSVGGEPRVVVDAKGPGEDLSGWVGQCVSYCATINRRFKGKNPVTHFVLSNGLQTLVFDVDDEEPILDVAFAEFTAKGGRLAEVQAVISPKALKAQAAVVGDAHKFAKLSVDEVNATFSWCHQHIYKKDALSQAAAFEEFVKLIFLKLISDRNIKKKYPTEVGKDVFAVPASDVKFSTRWIEAREDGSVNPLDALQFQDLLTKLEDEIRHKRKKRIFVEGSRIGLHPDTVKEVVRKLQGIYLFGIDADLNGRLFETFLSATMRGKDLGQFFTPRSVAKLGTKLADPQADKVTIERVLDGCCGTGGFLIDVLADVWGKIDGNSVLSASEKSALKERVAEEAIFGVDNAQEPNLARLARMNMYLHGDGGSSIYEADFLDKAVGDPAKATPEVRADVQQLRDLLKNNPDGFAHVVITNPPFAKVYDRKTEREARILDEYELAVDEEKLKSSLMFFERYHDVLLPGGRMVTVIDDGILSGSSYHEFREYLRAKFLIRGVISLPGDAFQRSQARVKTSFIVLEKRDPAQPQEQGPVFKYACRYVGIDDPNRQRTLPIDRVNKKEAKAEIEAVAALYAAFRAGKPVPPEHVIPADRLGDRLDAKAFEPTGQMLSTWKAKGIVTKRLSEILEPVDADGDDKVDLGEETEELSYLVVGYDGFAREGEVIATDKKTGGALLKVREDHLVLSHINAVNGSICVVPDYLDGRVVTSEFSAFTTKPGYDPRAVWAVLRSPEVRAELLLRASGAGRTRVKWKSIADLEIPLPDAELTKSVVEALKKAESELRAAQETRKNAQEQVQTALILSGERALATLAAFKPPR